MENDLADNSAYFGIPEDSVMPNYFTALPVWLMRSLPIYGK